MVGTRWALPGAITGGVDADVAPAVPVVDMGVAAAGLDAGADGVARARAEGSSATETTERSRAVGRINISSSVRGVPQWVKRSLFKRFPYACSLYTSVLPRLAMMQSHHYRATEGGASLARH
jgi:hypothetical protein